MWYESVKQSAGGVNVVVSGMGALVIGVAIPTEINVEFHADEACVGAIASLSGTRLEHDLGLVSSVGANA